MGEYVKKFLIKAHTIYVTNLNHISDDLLKVKYYFLLTISAIGFGYYYLSKLNISLDKSYPIIIYLICLLGNIIFWLISEYSLSHGFLFRYLQARIAKAELFFNQELINIPNKEDFFMRKNEHSLVRKSNHGDYFYKDHIIPDQFVPIYWASIWTILLNLALSTTLTYGHENFSFIWFYITYFISFLFIFKIFAYYIYKVRHFIKNTCDFDIILISRKCQNKIDFFELPHGLFCIFQVIIVIIVLLFIINTYLSDNYNLKKMVLSLVVVFWFPLFGIILHILKFILPFVRWGERFAPSAEVTIIDKKKYIKLSFESDRWLKFKHIYYLLSSIV